MWHTVTISALIFFASLANAAQKRYSFEIHHVNDLPQNSLSCNVALGDGKSFTLPSAPIHNLTLNRKLNASSSVSIGEHDMEGKLVFTSNDDLSFLAVYNSMGQVVFAKERLDKFIAVPIVEDGFFVLGFKSLLPIPEDMYGQDFLVGSQLKLAHRLAIRNSIKKYSFTKFIVGKFVLEAEKTAIQSIPQVISTVPLPSITLSLEDAGRAENLAMQVIFSYGLDGFKLDTKDANVPKIEHPMHNFIKISSDVGSATLSIDQKRGDHVEVRHSENSWIFLLRPDDTAENREIYPESIMKARKFEKFELEANLKGTSITIQKDGIFVLIVSKNANETFEISSIDLHAIICSIYADDDFGMKLFTDSLIKKYI